MPTKNIIEILMQNAERYPKKIAIQQGKESVSFEDLQAEVQRIACYFSEQGITTGDRVLLFVPLSIPLYKILLAIFSLGATAVFLDAWADRKRLEQACQIADCKAFIGIFKAHLLRLFSKEIRKIPLKFGAKIKKFQPKKKQDSLNLTVTADNVALITFTTGSTGIPKAAKRTHKFLLAQHRALVEHLKPAIEDLDMPTLPIFVLNNLAIGATSFLPTFDPRKPAAIEPQKILEEINCFEVKTTTGSPVFYEKLADYCLKTQQIPKKLKKIFLGGAPVFPALAEKLGRAFPETEVEVVYGSTEAEPISVLSAKELAATSTSITKGLWVGKPVATIQLRILKIEDAVLPIKNKEELDSWSLDTNNVGVICVTGEHVLKEYYNNPKAQAYHKFKVGEDIWHRTGDAGYLNEEGELFLMGRVQNRFWHENQYHYVFPLENFLLNLAGVNLGTVLKKNEKICFILELQEDTLALRNQVQQEIERLNFSPTLFYFLQKIPRDPRHHSKIEYHQLDLLLKEKEGA